MLEEKIYSGPCNVISEQLRGGRAGSAGRGLDSTALASYLHLSAKWLLSFPAEFNTTVSRTQSIGENRTEQAGAGAQTAGWSLPRVFSRMARASLSRLAASLYLF